MLSIDHLKQTAGTLSVIRSFRRFCKPFSESSPCLPGQQGSCMITVQLSENILQNLGNNLMSDSVEEGGAFDLVNTLAEVPIRRMVMRLGFIHSSASLINASIQALNS